MKEKKFCCIFKKTWYIELISVASKHFFMWTLLYNIWKIVVIVQISSHCNLHICLYYRCKTFAYSISLKYCPQTLQAWKFLSWLHILRGYCSFYIHKTFLIFIISLFSWALFTNLLNKQMDQIFYKQLFLLSFNNV